MRTSWATLTQEIMACQRCGLHAGCTRKVMGQGAPDAPLMIIGEGPGVVEDREGLAFVGPAGQLLTRMLAAIDLPRDRVYICNIVKCRPPNNRVPTPEEAAACLAHLRAQAALVRPRVILLLGATALNTLLGADVRITRDHGRWFERKGVSFIATFHPSALLRDESKKRPAWEDMKLLRARLAELHLYDDLLSPAGGKEGEGA